MSGGVVLFRCCLGLELTLHNFKGSVKNKFCCIFYKQQAIYLFLGLQGRESRVREPRGEEVLLVEVEEEQVLSSSQVTCPGTPADPHAPVSPAARPQHKATYPAPIPALVQEYQERSSQSSPGLCSRPARSTSSTSLY